MSFAKPKAAHGAGLDEYKKLKCTHPGCGHDWVINFDRPKCRFHQFGADIDPYKSIASDPFEPISHDGKQWARRIIKAHKDGQDVRQISLKFAKDALGMKGVV